MKNKKNLKIVLIILISLALLTGVAYAYFGFRITGKETNLIKAGCLKVVMEEENGINLTNSLPITDIEGRKQTPYVVRVTNNCDLDASYVATLNVLNTSGIGNENKVKVDIEGDVNLEPTLLESLDVVNLTNAPSDVRTSYKVGEGILNSGDSKEFRIRMWIDYAATSFNNPMNVEFMLDATAITKIEETFAYTGSYQKYVVPYSGYYKIEVSGAQGGASVGVGGSGAKVAGVINLTVNDELYFYVGNKSDTFNGGGNSSNANRVGGGATDVRYFGNYTPTASDLEWDSNLGLNSRIIVAGGGGGVSSSTDGAKGGDAWAYISQNGSPYASVVPDTYVGYGATQTAGGSGGTTAGDAGGFGTGGASAVYTDGHIGGGGGGGYYGGQGSKWHAGAGAGSSFISGVAGFNAITSSTSRVHTNNPLHYSGKYFVDEKFNLASVTGAGSAKISYLGPTYDKKNRNLDNVRYIKDCIYGSELHWTEIQAIYQGNNVAKGKTVTSTGEAENLNAVTDGLIDNSDFAILLAWDYDPVPLADYASRSVPEPTEPIVDACIIVDLGSTYNLNEIAVWHDVDGSSYNNHSIYVSSDNITWTTLNNISGRVEDSNGIRVKSVTKTFAYTADGYYGEYDGNNHGITVTSSGATIKYAKGVNLNSSDIISNVSTSLYLREGIYIFDNKTSGNTLNNFAIQIWSKDGSYLKDMSSIGSVGKNETVYVHEYDTGLYRIRVKANGSTADSAIMYDNIYFEKGKTYNISYEVTKLTSEQVIAKDVVIRTDYNLDSSPTYKDVGTYPVYYQISKPGYNTVTGKQYVIIR